MRVVRSLTVAVMLTALAGGCNRRGDGTDRSRSATTTTSDSAPVSSDFLLNGKEPAQALYNAIRIIPDAKKVKRLLDEHPDWINREISGERPLWLACEARSLPMVQVIVEHGADVKFSNAKHQTLLWPAVNYDDLAIVKYLIEHGADPKALQDDKQTLLWAAETKPMAEFLIASGVDPKHKDVNGDTALHQACRHSLLEVVRVLLDNGLDIEAKGHWDMRPLQSAASTFTGDPRPVVNLLLQRGANIDSHGYRGQTALHECALYNRLEMAELLLARGAQPDLKDDDGRTPVDTANLAGKSERALLINLLIQHGAPGVLIPIERRR
jgi:ankyrin repeat protein